MTSPFPAVVGRVRNQGVFALLNEVVQQFKRTFALLNEVVQRSGNKE